MDVRWMERAKLVGAALDLRGRSEIAAIGTRALITPTEAAAWARAVLGAKDDWTSDFDGEQFTLGRAFYTHYETEKSDEYFAGAAASDAIVERRLPGMQQRMRDLVAELTGGVARARREWCGAGVHVFPAGGEVARKGGVVHFDIEGLSEKHARDKRPALTIVLMLQEPPSGGGLRLWDVRFRGRDAPTDAELAAPSVVAQYGAGSALAIDSYRLHQIQPFSGDLDRVSITIHAAEVDDGIWETWF